MHKSALIWKGLYWGSEDKLGKKKIGEIWNYVKLETI